jgi:DNA-binding SARP family transcriptional activator/tetratricopeptide (TPR) repeat protein/type II secretory pathway predicted ATPase ExeA
VEIDARQLAGTLRGKQVPMLLAYLVLNRSRPVGRDELIGALWPYQAPQSQDAALRTLLSRLRSSLGAESLSGRDELVLELPEPVWIDLEAAAHAIVRAHETLEEGNPRGAWALAQVPLNIAGRGLLPGAQASWLEPRRRELEDIRLQALEVIGRAGLELGGTQLASVERAARTLIEAEPYRESGYVLLIESLAARGNVAEALRVFDRLRTLLRDELGTTPSAEAIAAHQRLVRPGSGGDGAQPITELELPGELRAHALAPLVGRAAELGQLEHLWAVACREEAPSGTEMHSTRLVLLTGDPGIGKTRLAAELATRVHQSGGVVMAGRAPEETLIPYQPLIEALRHYFLHAPLAQLRASVRDYRSELVRLVPELRRRVPDLHVPIAEEPDTERYRLFEAVVGLLTAISQSAPVVLVLDDLHWADRPTLLLLRHLARAEEPARLMILGAYRKTESAPEGFAQMLGELGRERLVTQLDVSGLTESETAELVLLKAGELPSPGFVRALHEETEGNPFFIEEIVRHLTEAGVHAGSASRRELQRFGLPEGVKQVIARRLERLDEHAIEWLRAAAVIGRDFEATLLERVVALDEDEFLNALDDVVLAGLVVASGQPDSFSFSHALIRETLYEGMSAPRRSRIHRRVAEALEAGEAERQLPAIAYHFAQAARAEDADKAITYACRAGEQATALLAHEEAAEHYARALEVLDRFHPEDGARRLHVLLALGEAQVRAGESEQGASTLREAAVLADRLGDGPGVARAAIGASRRYVQQPGIVDVELISTLRRALEMTAGERSRTRVLLLARLCGALYFSPERLQMKELSQEALRIAEELDDPEARAHACAARRRALWDAAHLQERLGASTEMLTFARQVGNLELELQAHAWLVVDLLEQGDRDGVDAQIEAFTAGAERLRQPMYSWNAIVWRAMRAVLAGALEQADELASQALRAGASAVAVTAPQYYAIQMLAIRREQGRMAELEPPARQLVLSNPARPAWRAALLTLLWETGRMHEAEAEFELLAANDFEDIPQDGDWMTAITLLSEACAELGDARRATSLYRMLLPYAETNVVIGLGAVCLGSTSRFLGRLAATMGREREAARHFERALAANAALKAPAYLAHTQLDYAQLLGDSPKATKLVEQAAKTSLSLGLDALAQRAARSGALPSPHS